MFGSFSTLGRVLKLFAAATEKMFEVFVIFPLCSILRVFPFLECVGQVCLNILFRWWVEFPLRALLVRFEVDIWIIWLMFGHLSWFRAVCL